MKLLDALVKDLFSSPEVYQGISPDQYSLFGLSGVKPL
jgi:hypothetical protein